MRSHLSANADVANLEQEIKETTRSLFKLRALPERNEGNASENERDEGKQRV